MEWAGGAKKAGVVLVAVVALSGCLVLLGGCQGRNWNSLRSAAEEGIASGELYEFWDKYGSPGSKLGVTSVAPELECTQNASQLHIALVDGPGNMSISWTCKCWIAPNQDSEKYSLKNLKPGDWEDSELIALVWKKSAGKEKAWKVGATRKRYFMNWHYRALATNLESNEVYCYEVGQAGDCFKTESTESRKPQGVHFASLGDMGTNNSMGTIAGLLRRKESYDFVVHGGDIAYGDDLGFIPDFDNLNPTEYGHGPLGYDLIYDQFMNQIEPLAGSVPYMVGVGNHDVSCDIFVDIVCPQGQRNFSAYRTRFRMPSEESGAHGADSMWYSFNYGNVHIAMIDTESDYFGAPTQSWTRVGGGRGGGFGDQIAWFENDMALASQNPNIDWIVVVGHRPLYSSKPALLDFPPISILALRASVEETMNKYKVDLYIGAHIHIYERLGPISHGKRCEGYPSTTNDPYLEPACPVYLVNGAAGNCETAEKQGIDPSDVVSGVYKEYGFADVHVHNSTHLEWTYFVTTDGKDDERDSFWIVKSAPQTTSLEKIEILKAES
mmetsp:Transcript_17862/g.35261  ORF Transcript_17862/g.35261 Transcript_17862/m.35261 type:complete len:553 (+) Transcript_17862:66-1724(+)|eukprot:CAMPEP_0171493606 /NCGR_PEP_ID=MMETSP0958-20121227/5056_1 /TAXON_ID=87120 /ORGANISM="Aurantiochytrium limacinum, Strain ATCCMYA-1381" /LENGTH=552 /DNA_ID=CAMNT_0012027249 /DNA_START=48 /DNA_END=1706 /DNA_ORIENTATION=+